MRLLQRLPGDSFELTYFHDDRLPPYAILSHTWTECQEVTYHELIAGTGRNKTGFDKIRFCGERAAADGLQYFWVDACCIDKTNQVELSTAINSMFRWYQRASRCYVYLSDVSITEEIAADSQTFRKEWIEAFRQSRWFTRGWTLQELIAPASVEFFSKESQWLGSKVSLEQDIYEITGIPVGILRGQSLEELDVEERLSWAAHRTTSLREDKVYCLLGIFGVFLPLIYGEGETYATKRLREEIEKRQAGWRPNHINPSCHNAAKPETPVRPCCAIPFRRDPDFVDRGTLLNELQEKSSMSASRVALVGLGGVGKSQLAIEHCYRTAERSPDTWVFWAHAGNTARLEQSYQEIADQVEIRGRNDPQADVFKLVHNWLRNEQNGRWLLVIDNADDAAVFSPQPSNGQKSQVDNGGRGSSGALRQHLSRYLPSSRHGSVLVTSRTRRAAIQFVEDSDIISIKPMHDVAAYALLHKKLGSKNNESAERDRDDGIAELAAALDYMPLALVQAAAYIRERAPRFSVQQYLDEYHQSDNRKTSLLNHEAGHLRRDEAASNSVLITWQISFDYIRRQRKSAADLLSLMSFFDRQGIQEALLRSQSGRGDDDEFDHDVVTLRDYSFITVTTDPDTFEMHSLVQLATRTWLENKGQLERWRGQFISRLCAELPTGQHENWAKCQALFPHAKAALAQRPKGKESFQLWAKLLYNAAWYAWQRGRAGEAEEMSTVSMKVRGEVLGEENAATLSSMGMVGLAMKLGGRLKEAEIMERQIVVLSEKVLGPEHLDTLTSMNNLASTLDSQGKYEEAEVMHRQTLAWRERVLGLEHTHTLISMNNLAGVLDKQERYKEAEVINRQTLAQREKVVGLDHPDTLTSMSNLALILYSLRKYEEAETLNRKTLAQKEKILGPEHPSTLTTMNNLSGVLLRQGKSEEAEAMSRRALARREDVLGPEHPDTLLSVYCLAGLLLNQHRYNESLVLYERACAGHKVVLGEHHPITRDCHKDYATALASQEQSRLAISSSILESSTSTRIGNVAPQDSKDRQ